MGPGSDTSGIETSRSLALHKKLIFASLPLLLLFGLGELALRVHRGAVFSADSLRSWRLVLLKSGYPAQYDAELGYVPLPGTRTDKNVWGTTVTIDDRGFRSNGGLRPTGGRTILAVGDSFTFGDEVSDDETWPAHLERLLDAPVLNAGVFGYGVDQMVLRLERLLSATTPDVVIVAVLPDDVSRSELSCRFAWKPYFDVENGALELKNVPVPTDYEPQPLKQVLGYSHLFDYLMSRIAPGWWLSQADTIRAHDKGPAVCELLVDRIDALRNEYGFELLVVFLGRGVSDDLLIEPMLKRARQRDVETLNLLPRMRELEQDPDVRARWRSKMDHLSSEGNRWVAGQIAEALGGVSEDSRAQ